MRKMRLRDLQKLLDSSLPSGCVSYISLSALSDSIIVKYYGPYHQEKYFEKEYSYRLSEPPVEHDIIKDAYEFTSLWNSPLMKALR